ncbi:MAG: TFIIB-type zinc ribbon-containing protein [Dehalococcoidia bacterium]|nr:MAG: TFIIB-type zinc ribbon-containing protein [Dehalococcoidia bacterium]
MTENHENEVVKSPGEEDHKADTAEASTAHQCPFCGSSEISQDREKGNWRCTKCEQDFQPQSEAVEEDGAAKVVKAPWEQPQGATMPGKYDSSTKGLKPHRIDEGTALLLLPVNLQFAFNWILKLAMILGGIFAVVLGGHGLHVYFNAVEGLLPEGRDGADLFLETDVPGQIKGIVEWCSNRGLSSWTVPTSLIQAGPLLWLLQTYVQARRFRR